MQRKMGILGQKVGMTQVFAENGTRVPVTVLRAGPSVVLQKKTTENDGYVALQLGFHDKEPRRTRRPDAGRFAKASTPPKRFVREVRLDDDIAAYEVGQAILPGDVFHKGDHVDVIGTSKGKGFQGVVKRYHFKGAKASHGAHEYYRHPGAIGCRLTPGRVHKGKRMPGHMGNARVTANNLIVVDVLGDENLLLIRGAVPGPNGGYVIVRGTKKPVKAAQAP